MDKGPELQKITSFEQRCYNLLRQVPPGCVVSYGDIARKLKTRAYRAVGHAMHRNPYSPQVPCHRVVHSDGRLGGFAKGLRKKIQLLESEGVSIRNGRIVDFKSKKWRF